ncbi:MAG: glutamate racemase [Candidatus Chisholmbacteria bacterium RIFCSPLOWO2_01_FULL_49_14]|uniref:Glutamate racemase n=1 Tax=Candidatus Chisholmbacteria bacterium RIFCSPLOWO2_01_FULL_49_14 TaxID=1797593 RepID=A0A1G1W370_9BACT|nr:MAG: glutamate racemase [Candidatus Chisholmbacteria bacterium RIFCSPLOWO2_01_FULL_49_14]
MKRDSIGLFDSGIGGLSILRQISRLMTREDMIYVADEKYVPYGNKSNTRILDRAKKITRFLVNEGAGAIVVACNTATVVALEALRRNFPLPFVGVEPAVKPAARLSQTGEITVLATVKTVKSRRQRELILRHASGVKVHLLAAPEFVTLVEEGLPDATRVESAVKDFFFNNNLGRSDIVVLACTHYIFLKDVIAKILPGKTIIEPSMAVARRLRAIRKGVKIQSRKPGNVRFVTTGKLENFSRLLKHFGFSGIAEEKAL